MGLKLALNLILFSSYFLPFAEENCFDSEYQGAKESMNLPKIPLRPSKIGGKKLWFCNLRQGISGRRVLGLDSRLDTHDIIV